jgi:23S rRNA pseudouridine1911/1915/1917 synthase
MSEEEALRIEVPRELDGQRVDRAAAALLGGALTRTKVRRLIEDGNLLLDGRDVKPSSRVESGQVLEIFVPPPPPADLAAQDIPLTVVYEDEDLIVINKASGMVVHPAAGNPDGTLVNALLHHCGGIEAGDAARPGIVHRLDKDTSGLMVAAKNERTHALLSAMFATKSVVRVYVALVYGRPGKEGLISTPYGRSPGNRRKFTGKVQSQRRAVTRYRRLESFDRAGVSLLELVLETGRTHQIRVHMTEAGWPVLGDPVYGRRHVPPHLKDVLRGVDHTLLHSGTIEFSHPTRGSWIRLTAEPEPIFQEVLARLEAFEKSNDIKK